MIKYYCDKYCEENGKVKKKEKEWEKNYWR